MEKENKNPRQIIIIDDQPPEAVAMLQALYSRDPKSVVDHLEKVKISGPEKFMASYYVGYGHKSIGDCGTTTIFVEQVSLLVTKAFQEWSLYNGQEASTRYLDMSKQEVINPLETKEGKIIQDEWMKIYTYTLEKLQPFLKEQFPKKEDQEDKIYEKAIKAKAFDIARGLLPAGVTTLFSWHTNLRQAYDHIHELNYHPLKEVRDVAKIVHDGLKTRYSSSFSHKTYHDQEAYLAEVAKELTYGDTKKIPKFKYSSNINTKELSKFKKFLKTRPQKTELPAQIKMLGNMRFEFPLDFGSFRDLQRHRSGSRVMPLLGIKHDFFPWYIEQMPKDLQKEVLDVIKKQEKRIRALKCSPEVKQYYVAIGYTVSCVESFSLPASIYVAELRSGQTVHPTLRIVAQRMGEAIKKEFPGIAMHHDMSPDTWSIKRGSQDIVKKN